MRLLEKFEDGHRFGEPVHAASVVDFENRHVAHWIQGAKFWSMLLTPVASQMDRGVFVRESLVRERDAHAPRRRAPPKTVETHSASLTPTSLACCCEFPLGERDEKRDESNGLWFSSIR
jgi:hypothetical protein